MDLTSFYSLMGATCFTLVGLWWTVVERHPRWKSDPQRRKLAGGTYLSFLLPGLMSTLATIAPDAPLVWRITFALTAVVGLASTITLIRVETGATPAGPFRRHRWLVALVYVLIFVLGVFPEVARALGSSPIQVAGVLLVLLIVLAHGLTWEFMMEPDETVPAPPPRQPGA
ncbi:MAG: hypothetical protein HZY73_16420 [Micropruina sp.]|nr:MAG: hypothetical protein HZY73_16420 [Micropruina sp.]